MMSEMLEPEGGLRMGRKEEVWNIKAATQSVGKSSVRRRIAISLCPLLSQIPSTLRSLQSPRSSGDNFNSLL